MKNESKTYFNWNFLNTPRDLYKSSMLLAASIAYGNHINGETYIPNPMIALTTGASNSHNKINNGFELYLFNNEFILVIVL